MVRHVAERVRAARTSVLPAGIRPRSASLLLAHPLTGCDDGCARLWDLENASTKPIVYGQNLGHVRGVALSPDELLVLTACSDNTLRLWDRASGQARLVLRGHRGTSWRAAFTPDGRQVVSAARDGTIRWWWVATPNVLAAADRLGIGPLTAEERTRFAHLLGQ